MSDNNDQPSLNVVDIQNAVRALDIATEQGAWRTWTVFETVYNLRNKFNNFAEAVAAAEAAKEAATVTDESAALAG